MTDCIHFHTGYHTGPSETYAEMSSILSQVKNDDFTDNSDVELDRYNFYKDASIFLQGACHLFSLALHQEFGFEAYRIRFERSIHYFCISTYNGRKVYIDIRGATTNFQEFVSGTMLPNRACSDYEFTPQNIEEDAKLEDEDDYFAEEGLAFAKKLIQEHPEHYGIGLQ